MVPIPEWLQTIPGVRPWGSCLSQGDVATISCLAVVIENIIATLLFFSTIVAAFLIVLAGIKFITSGGDKEKVASAQKSLTFTIIGFVLIVLSYSLFTFLVYTFGVSLSNVTTIGK